MTTGEVATSTAAPATNSIDDVIPARLRVDIIVRRQFFKHQEYYVVKDALALTYYRLQPEEAYVLTLLDGKRTMLDISRRYNRRYPNQPRSVMELAQFINQLAAGGLLNVSAKGFVENAMRGRHAPHFLSIWAKVVSTVLFLKIPLLDPSLWLGRVTHTLRFLWSKWFVGGALLLFVWTAGLLLVNAGEFTGTGMDFFSASNLILVWFSIIIIKTLHEFGHAMTCRHFGGEVHEMGVCLMLFTPCGYVDASDAWMMRHKRHKVFVTIAGVFTELIIACIAAHAWLVLPEGIARSLAFNAMIVASVNTIIFNINPLMRFDGYYVFSDLLEIPNLRSKAVMYVSFHLQRIFLGYRNRQQELMFEQDAHGRVFLIYAIFAYGYMITLIWGVTQMFGRILQPYGLHGVGLYLGYFIEGSFVVLPFIKVFMDATNPGAHIVKTGSTRRRLAFIFGGLAALVGLAFVFPSHHHVSQQAVVTPDLFEGVASEVGGVVKSVHVRTGQWVEDGQLLVTLDNPEIVADLRIADAARQQVLVRFGAMRNSSTAHAAEAQPKAAQDMEGMHALYGRAEARAKLLEIRARTAGYVITPDVEQIVGSYAIPGTPILRLGDSRQLRLIIPLTEDEAQLVRAGAPVTGRWLATGRSFKTTLRSVSSQPANSSDYQWGMAVHYGGTVPTQQLTQHSRTNSHFPIFIATASLANPGHSTPPGLRVRVDIEGEKTTIGRKVWRSFLGLFDLRKTGHGAAR